MYNIIRKPLVYGLRTTHQLKKAVLKYQLNRAILKWIKKITVKVKVIKCRNSKRRKLGFSHVLEQYLDRFIKDHYKETSSLWNEVNESVHESNNPMDEVI